jgi:hypothetical protein
MKIWCVGRARAAGKHKKTTKKKEIPPAGRAAGSRQQMNLMFENN